ncbi:hypothetical protein ACIRYZ_15075 [Kitasatospora sp. NPDC101155]|uniref:hypothetical protein n=1 Tax=Kitasatospora sp. NPDC101155 TaxID=3364097 RepID=UPI0037F76FA4
MAVEELQQGRWMAARAVLASSWGSWPLWTGRTQVLAAVAARTNVLDYWYAEAPDSTGLVTLLARVAVERALLTGVQPTDPRVVAGLEQSARQLCWDAAATLADDPVPWICMLALAQLDLSQSRPEHRISAPDQMLPPGPWGLLAQVRRADPWNREAFHRLLRFWLAQGDGGSASDFLAAFLPGAPTGSPLHALPLYLYVDLYRRAERRDKERARLRWTKNEQVRATVLRAYENWRAAPGEQGRWPLVDESHLAHALWATRCRAQAAEVFASMAPFISSQPWVSVGDRPDAVLREALAQSMAATR